MRLAIANSTAYCPPEILVRWLSGRKQRFAKAPYLSKGTEGSNPSLTVLLRACRRFAESNLFAQSRTSSEALAKEDPQTCTTFISSKVCPIVGATSDSRLI